MAETSGSSNFFSAKGGSILVSANRTWYVFSAAVVAVFAAADNRRTTCVAGGTWTTETSTEMGGGPAGVSVQVRLAASHAPVAPASGNRIFSRKSAGA
jgi:hypothetical protein